MQLLSWKDNAAAISPLFGFTEVGSWGGESGVLDRIFSLIPEQTGFAVEFGQRSIGAGTVAELIAKRGWGALYMDLQAASPLEVKSVPANRTVTLARERISPSNINALFAKYEVPDSFDCLVIDIDGLDYWVWEAIDPRYQPSLVVVEFNAHVALGVEASIVLDDTWVYRSSRDYGASFSALCNLAARKGYRLIHAHGPWNLYFLKNDIAFPSELSIRPVLTESDFSVLTDVVAFYDEYCGRDKRPSWFDAPPPDVSRRPWEILAPDSKTARVDIEGVIVEVLADKNDGNWYLQRKTFEEKASLLYKFIRQEEFNTFVDVGANYGFVSMLAQRAAPGLSVIAIEADPRLAKLVSANFVSNGLEAPDVVNAIAGDRSLPSTRFSLNPKSTLDNRVCMPQWQQISIPMLAIAELLDRRESLGKTFFKIDTQGFELQVLQGMEAYLSSQRDWVLKMEFAPHWLLSQGTDPLLLLDYLQSRYQFAEYPERIPFGTQDLNALFALPVGARQHEMFLKYVESLNKGDLGWVDLIVRPRL